ncbi:MAG: PEGA domain-containing protein [Deltaproteobacteria bacterium]|nr:PEGA domain-containing protein [Deltaproteobacteria bacterium]MBW2285363.1 PEGA domain-containing protein [Deltaproteobacteria bacterium]
MRDLRLSFFPFVLCLCVMSLLPSAAGASPHGKLHITSEPAGAAVYIDGQFFHKTPADIRLETGYHRIRLEKKDFAPFYEEIDIRRRDTVRIHARMEALDRFGALVIKSRPSGADIRINGVLYDRTPARIRLWEGNHQVEVEKYGYKPHRQKVFVPRARVTVLSPVLNPVERYGTLHMSSDPSGARVFIDGAFYDRTPLRVRLPAGNHDIKVKKRGYAPYIENVPIHPDAATVRNVRLIRKGGSIGTLMVRSNPQDATVKIDGMVYGQTPLEIDLPTGYYKLEVRKKGYKPVFTEAVILEREITLRSANLRKIVKPAAGRLNVTSRPTGAWVFVDGGYVGATPLTIPLPAGAHQVQIRKPGFLPFEEKVRVRAGIERNFQAVLAPAIAPVPPRHRPSPVPLTGSIEIISQPLNARVFVDGWFYGETPLTIEFRAGPHTLQIKRPGFYDYRQDIRVMPGQRTVIRAQLQWMGYRQRAR